MKIRILIVEDEKPIQRSLVGLLEMMNTETEVIGIAEDGTEALRLYAEKGADLIITDIQMPVMNGLTLIENIRLRDADIPIAILTGYRDFSFAQKALQLGVSDYLVKPLDLDELSSFVHKTERIISARQEQQWMQYFHHAVLPEDNPAPQARATPQHSICVALMAAGPYPMYPFDYDIPAESFWRTPSHEELLCSTLRECGTVYWVSGIYGIERIAFVMHTEGCAYMAERIASIVKDISFTFPFPLHIATLDVSEQDALPEAIVSLRKTLMSHIPLNGSLLLSTSDFPAKPQNVSPIVKYMMEELSQIDIHSSAFSIQLQQVLATCFAESLPKQKLLQHLQKLLDKLLQTHMIESPLQAYNVEIDELVTTSSDARQMGARYTSLLRDALQTPAASTPTQHDPIKQAVDYVERHYREAFSIQELSKEIGFEASYLSKQFKSRTGMTPLRYQSELRMKKASELMLNDPALRIKDIAEYVGYQDPLYFSRKFKDTFSRYPSEYRTLHL